MEVKKAYDPHKPAPVAPSDVIAEEHAASDEERAPLRGHDVAALLVLAAGSGAALWWSHRAGAKAAAQVAAHAAAMEAAAAQAVAERGRAR